MNEDKDWGVSDWQERAELWKRECKKSDAKLAKIKQGAQNLIESDPAKLSNKGAYDWKRDALEFLKGVVEEA